MKQPKERVMLHAFGSATLTKRYPHHDTKETVWEVLADSGQRFHLSKRYVEMLETIGE